MVADPGSPEGGGQLCIMLLPNPTQVSLEDMPSLPCWRSSQDALQRKKVAVPVTAPPPLTAISHIVVAIPAHPQLPWIRAYWWCPPHPGPSPGHWQIFRRVCHLPAEMLAHPLPPSSPRTPVPSPPAPSPTLPIGVTAVAQTVGLNRLVQFLGTSGPSPRELGQCSFDTQSRFSAGPWAGGALTPPFSSPVPPPHS